MKRNRIILLVITIVSLLLFYFSIPGTLFKVPYSTSIIDRNGNLLAAKIADDGQWRMQSTDDLPAKFSIALLEFEDRHFYFHQGVRWESIGRALLQNIRSKRIVSGGSTISMQVIRISKKNPPRTVFNKLLEIIQAYRLELSYSKKEVLQLYADHAPFGGNVVGIQAAAWRYYGKDPQKLTWAESALLAVLPNSPGLLFPGKNEKKLKQKRDRLLKHLQKKGYFTEQDFLLYQQEPLPLKPLVLPSFTNHLLDRAIGNGLKGKQIISTIDAHLQQNVIDVVAKHHQYLSSNLIQNCAVLVLDVKNNTVISYVGNTLDKKNRYSNQVDIINSPRSTGSILKPFLYAAMLNEGEILPGTLVPDVPTQIAGFVPENSSRDYDGVVSAKQALARSLNIPAVKLLQQYKYERFYDLLKKIGISSLNKPASHYGLSMILGGAEGTLWDVCNAYAAMARSVIHYPILQSRYNKNDFLKATFVANEKNTEINLDDNCVVGAGAAYKMFEAIVEVARPEEDAMWKLFSSSQKIAWKTGTSFGNRDAWAIGTTPDYVVGVWCGNASGEGRAELSGIGSAAPVLFDVFSLLPKKNKWFAKPYDDLVTVNVCRKSGQLFSDNCETNDSIWVPVKGKKTELCKYHKLIFTDANGRFRVTDECESVTNMQQKKWFVLPPVMEYYYKQKHPLHVSLPPFKEGCGDTKNSLEFELIYPKSENKIFIPIDLNGKKGKVIFKGAHRNKTATLFWHIDDNFIRATENGMHQIAFDISEGKHKLVLVDDSGMSITKYFEVISD